MTSWTFSAATLSFRDPASVQPCGRSPSRGSPDQNRQGASPIVDYHGGRSSWPNSSSEGGPMRRDTTHPRQFAFGPFRLLPTRQLLLEGDSPVRLGARARDLLIALVEQAGEVITKEALNARLWPNIVVEEATLRVHVAALRKALRDGQEGQRYIANIAGRGYAFVGEVAATDEPDPAADVPTEPMPPLSMGRLFG